MVYVPVQKVNLTWTIPVSAVALQTVLLAAVQMSVENAILTSNWQTINAHVLPPSLLLMAAAHVLKAKNNSIISAFPVIY